MVYGKRLDQRRSELNIYTITVDRIVVLTYHVIVAFMLLS